MEDSSWSDFLLENIAYHVFLPPKLPQKAPTDIQGRLINHRLAEMTLNAVNHYIRIFSDESGQWARMARMLSNLAGDILGTLGDTLAKNMASMKSGDVLALYIEAQNAAVIVRKSHSTTTFEIFEAQAPSESVMSVPGKLVRHFPGPAIQIPNSTANDGDFIDEIANFLAQMNVDVFDDAVATTVKAGSEVTEARNVTDPKYITQLFAGILRGFGKEIEPRRVLKRIADEVLWDEAHIPWRRSPIWLIIRVALQTSVTPADYKHFMVHLHVQLLGSCCDDSFSSDLLMAMRVKMTRRLIKVQKSAPEPLVSSAKAASERVEKILKSRWSAIQAEVPEFESLKLDQAGAIVQSLPHSRKYINQVLQGRSSINKSSNFIPNHSDRLVGSSGFSIFANDALTLAFEESKHLALFDFEDAVHERLSSWVDVKINHGSKTACAIISSCLEQYTSAALSYYKEDVADRSIMILTVLELWVALDRLITSRQGILLYYSPEIPHGLIETLLFCSPIHLERATMVQAYIRSRRKNATRGSVFDSDITQDSLSVQFFSQSSELQEIKREIEQEAERQRDEKINEMDRLNAEYDILSEVISAATCETWTDWRTGYSRHDYNCAKCLMEREKNRMKIDVHEWPLPVDQLDAESVVFELRCPEEINLWRTATFKVLCDFGGSTCGEDSKIYDTLADYDSLLPWSSQLKSSNHRITVASASKSFRDSHYSNTSIPATKAKVCVNNGLQFMLFDAAENAWAYAPFNGMSLAKYGTFKLPAKSPYRYLQFSLAETKHTSNQILADQSNCPETLSLHEHYAFGTLRSGPRLQWINIIRGLEENILTFSREEVYLLHAQAAWQIGVLSKDNTSRDWHYELTRLEFGHRLVQQASRVLDRVQSNWLEATTVRTIVMLIARLLSSTTETTVHAEAYKFLRKARDVTFTWLEQLSRKLRDAVADSQISNYQQRVCEMAAICRSTYDVGSFHLSKLLFDRDDYITLVSCSVALYDNQPIRLEKVPQHLQTLLCRDRRLSFKTLPVILEKIRRDPQILDSSVSRSWHGYRPGARGWTKLSAPNSRWVTTISAHGLTMKGQQVHLNLLEGRLLVDGQPLGRLPRNYVEHPTYSRLFGQKVLDVIPANSPGMVFTTTILIEKNQVSLCMDETNKELIVQTLQDGATFELIPHSKLAKDFPIIFSSEYYHWINLNTRVIEFRPLSNPWSPDGKNWHLRCLSSSLFAMERIVEDGKISLYDIHSRVFQDIAHRISPLESPRHLHVTRSSHRNAEIKASLPRMKLGFFINKDAQLESRNFREQVIDNNQSIGTMFGLQNQLVLRAKDSNMQSLPQSRSVLIPYGSVDFALEDNHPIITIDHGPGSQATFYQYKIDTDLGYLVNSNADLTSRLFKIYLHALTSHCLPDPLTGRTGTEEALHELDESATTSFEQITQEQALLLKLIGKLTPQRVYYPAHLTAMQTTTWADLSPLSQHYAFCTAANSILERARSLHMFSPLGFELNQYITKPTKTLLQRATYRTQIYYPVDAVGELPTLLGGSVNTNHWYGAKDHMSEGWTEQCQFASWASQLANNRWGKPTYLIQDMISQFEEWDRVEGPNGDLELKYSRDWLDLDLSSSWLTLYDLCRQTQQSGNRYQLNICLAAGAYSCLLPLSLVPVLISFAENPLFESLEPPSHAWYQLSDGYIPVESRISSIVSAARRGIEDTPSIDILRGARESVVDWVQRQEKNYESEISTHQPQLIQLLLNSWPKPPSVPLHLYSSWFDLDDCLRQVRSYFDSCLRNLSIQSHLEEVEEILSSGSLTFGLEYSSMPTALPKPRPERLISKYPLLSFNEVATHRALPMLESVPIESTIPTSSIHGEQPDTTRLQNLLAEFHGDSSRPICQRYGSDLETSRANLSKFDIQASSNLLPSISSLETNRAIYQDYLRRNLKKVQGWLGPITQLDCVVFASGIWPRLTPRSLLSKLALRARASASLDCQVELQKYARAYIEYQRSQRLIGLALDQKHDEFFKELNLANISSDDEVNHPDWLLVQIDGNFSTRRIQTQVAREMITPSLGASTVLQLNMGEGKSSVIVPIVAASLADNTRLVRVVVLKPLWRQMFHLLVSRLSGLVNRRIYYLPFGRHIRVEEEQAAQIQKMYEECMREGGILLVQPEHILSFKLMGIDQLLSSSAPKYVAASKRLRETQNWLFANARDILDESDEILHVRYRLVYTFGKQQPLEGHPERWTTTQQVLSLVANHISQLKQAYPDKLKYESREDGQFPFVRIMPESDDAIAQLISSIAEDSMKGLVPNLNLSLLPQRVRGVVSNFLTNRDVPHSEAEMIQNLDSSLRSGLLLLRGLLACGIIAFALRDKHYRVDYGLHLSRSLLAVPYRAKDIPSLRAEFGHPDVAVVLTCLSYYYQGLNERQLDTCFELLFKLDNPDLEYEQWVGQNKTTPSHLYRLANVNLKDREQFTQELVPTFARNAAVVNFFLSSVVFPREAKQFSHKLSTSGWDLAEAKTHVTTGFSGTNDNQYLSPPSIRQSDPVKQSATNARVLTYLLQPENNFYLPIQRANGETCSATEFLDMLVKQESEIRVLLDVGAQMLELTNHELVVYWLSLQPDAAAAVYFNDNDELVILPRNGSPTPFHSSAFSQQMDRCIVYLDDGHTRGTDLKLPNNTRAAVTLGPNVTKDRLLQGCMRMRNLGFGQSVVFCAPPEIDAQIRKAGKLTGTEHIEALDVIRWAMLETCRDLEHYVSHWAQQGVEYKRRAKALNNFAYTQSIKDLERGWVTPESRTLEQMYGASSSATGTTELFTRAALKIPDLEQRLSILGVSELEDPSMDEEQEREVSHEVERQQQVERPLKSRPASHSVHSDVRRFVRTGALPSSDSLGITMLSKPLKAFGVSWSSKLFASWDFCKTIEATDSTQLSEYMRPLNWVLSGPNDALLVLSPFEANQLFFDIRNSAFVKLHVFAPRVTHSMLSFSDLQFYSASSLAPFPSPKLLLRLQLSLFAGQLYLSSYEEYRTLCGFLGLFVETEVSQKLGDIRILSDGFVPRVDRQRLSMYMPEYAECRLTASPVRIVKDLVAYRRKGMEYLRTHLGQVLHARPLVQDDFSSW